MGVVRTATIVILFKPRVVVRRTSTSDAPRLASVYKRKTFFQLQLVLVVRADISVRQIGIENNTGISSTGPCHLCAALILSINFHIILLLGFGPALSSPVRRSCWYSTQGTEEWTLTGTPSVHTGLICSVGVNPLGTRPLYHSIMFGAPVST